MKKQFLFLVMAMSLFACQPEGRIFVEHQDLSPEVEWLKKDVKTFNVNIEDTSIAYDLSLSFRFAEGFPYKSANVKVKETSPAGLEVVSEYELVVREDDGSYIGEAGLDIWDSEHKVESAIKYKEVGSYTYEITQNSTLDTLVFAMEIGVILDKAK